MAVATTTSSTWRLYTTRLPSDRSVRVPPGSGGAARPALVRSMFFVHEVKEQRPRRTVKHPIDELSDHRGDHDTLWTDWAIPIRAILGVLLEVLLGLKDIIVVMTVV